MTAVVAVAGARIEQGIPAKQRGRVGVRQQAYVTHGMPGGIERFELDGLADLDDVPGAKRAIDARNALTGILVRQQLGAGRCDHGAIAAGMIAVLVRIQI